jgi:hypothetical protein
MRRMLARRVSDFNHQVKVMLRVHREQLITRQAIQARLSWCAVWLHTVACCLARVDRSIRNGTNGQALQDELRIVRHICNMADDEIAINIRALRHNTDRTMPECAAAAVRAADALPNSNNIIPEKTPDQAARGTGRVPDQAHVPQFGTGSAVTATKVP